jgi:hypothetical protein
MNHLYGPVILPHALLMGRQTLLLVQCCSADVSVQTT